MSNIERGKFSINHAEAFVEHVRLQLQDQLQAVERAKHIPENSDEKEALFFERLNYFIGKTQALMTLVEHRGEGLMKISPSSLYETFLGILHLDENPNFAIQNARLKLACLRLVKAREVVLKYTPSAIKNPKDFIQNQVIPDDQQVSEGLVDRVLRPTIKGAKIIPKPFCLAVQLKPKDYKKLTGYDPDVYRAMAFGTAKNPELNQRVYLTSSGGGQALEDIQRHEEMHIVYWTFANGDHAKPIFNPSEMPTENGHLVSRLKEVAVDKADYYLHLLQTEFISNAYQKTPVVYSRLFEYGVDVYMTELANMTQFIVSDESLSDQDKQNLVGFMKQVFSDYLQASRQYVKSARALFRHSTLSHSAIVALLLSVPVDKLSSVADHYIQEGMLKDYHNPLWVDIERSVMSKGHVRWNSYNGGTKRAPNMEANDTYEDEAWEEARERLDEWLDEIKMKNN